MSEAFLLCLFEPGVRPAHEIIAGIPKGTKIVNVRHGWPNVIEILLESEDFPEVAEGDVIPQLTVTVRNLAAPVVPISA